MKVVRIVLAVVFAWSLFKTLELLMRRGSVDRLIFEGTGLPWLFWFFLIPLALLQASALYYLWRPSSLGYRLAQAAVILGAAETVVAAAIGYRNPALMKQAIVTSRAERGLPVREEVLQLADNPLIHLFPILLGVVLAAVWLFLLFKTRQPRLPSRSAAF